MNDAFPPDPREVLIIHASAARFGDKVAIFLGPSETGKSTICRLLNHKWTPIADDLVGLITRTSGTWAVFDADLTPIPKTYIEAQAMAQTCPSLKVIYRLYQAPALDLVRVNPLQTVSHLTDAFFEVRCQRLYNVEMKRLAFTTMSRIAKHVPGHRLYFTISSQVFKAVEAGLFGEHTFSNNSA